jgi:hypothetical protein
VEPGHTSQLELVREYCSEAGERILMARSRADATDIKEQLCDRFRQECESDLIINATSAYLDEIIIRHWKENQE